MSESYNKLISTLQTIFEMDKADLDFGIYRIMNQNRDEINRFLEQDLLPQVKQAFADYSNDGNQGAQAELGKLIQTLNDAGMDPEQSPKVVELRQQLASAVDVTALENDVFSKLHTFLSRYYDKGDFISQRRYKADTYAIPYEGEEVKLYWANHDQYYIKSSEHLRDYAFIAKDTQDNDKPVRIKLVEADTEKDNVKAKSGEERRFVLDEQTPLSIEDGELLIHFNFIPVGKKKQTDLNKAAVESIFKQTAAEFSDWLTLLKSPAPTEKDAKRTILEKHLNDYTARNTFDYFIHKDLGGFLNRELDFYIKNEVMHLDDIDDASFELTQQQLRKIKILRSIAQKIIRMLAQIEDFQKKLWLKKKIVVSVNYCLSMELLPQGLIADVITNKGQLSDWEKLYGVDKLNVLNDLKLMGESEFLSNSRYKYLYVDTKYFNQEFKEKLLSSIDNIDDKCSGLLVNGDNFHGISLLNGKYKNSIDMIYIDPPYNTDAGPIIYKNGFRNSSWITMMDNRLKSSIPLFNKSGVSCVTIDDYQVHELSSLVDSSFRKENQLGTAVIRNNPSGRSTVNGFSVCHEYALFSKVGEAAQLSRLPRSEKQLKRFTIEDSEYVDWRNFRKDGGAVTHRNARPKQFYPLYVNKESLSIRIPELEWDAESKTWEILEEHDENEQVLYPIDENNRERVWSLNHLSAVDNMQHLKAEFSRSGALRVMRRHKPSDGVLPRTWWDKNEYAAREHGSAVLTKLFGEPVFTFAKSPSAVRDCLWVGGMDSPDDTIVLDYFAGSGTTAHAIIDLNRIDSGCRKYILVEMGDYFEGVLIPRIKKTSYTAIWKNGVPETSDDTLSGYSHMFKCLKLESYEDALNNLQFTGNNQSQSLLSGHSTLREDYMLGYWLDVETADSPSLLNIEQFEDPFNYKLNIGSGSVGATTPTTVDLVETFNYLIGLTVKTMDVIRGFKIVTGTNPKGESVLVVWRNLKEKDNAALEEFLDKQGYNPRDTEFEHIYVNGDHTLEDPQSKVKMTEIEFKRLMFDVKDV